LEHGEESRCLGVESGSGGAYIAVSKLRDERRNNDGNYSPSFARSGNRPPPG